MVQLLLVISKGCFSAVLYSSKLFFKIFSYMHTCVYFLLIILHNFEYFLWVEKQNDIMKTKRTDSETLL